MTEPAINYSLSQFVDYVRTEAVSVNNKTIICAFILHPKLFLCLGATMSCCGPLVLYVYTTVT